MHDPDYRPYYKSAAIGAGATGVLSFAAPFVLSKAAPDLFLSHPALLDSLPPLCMQPAMIAFALCLPAVWIGWMGKKHVKK